MFNTNNDSMNNTTKTNRSLHLVKIFEKLVPHLLQFSPDGKLLCVGFSGDNLQTQTQTEEVDMAMALAKRSRR